MIKATRIFNTIFWTIGFIVMGTGFLWLLSYPLIWFREWLRNAPVVEADYRSGFMTGGWIVIGSVVLTLYLGANAARLNRTPQKGQERASDVPDYPPTDWGTKRDSEG